MVQIDAKINVKLKSFTGRRNHIWLGLATAWMNVSKICCRQAHASKSCFVSMLRKVYWSITVLKSMCIRQILRMISKIYDTEIKQPAIQPNVR